jgi:hypothetical protein
MLTKRSRRCGGLVRVVPTTALSILLVGCYESHSVIAAPDAGGPPTHCDAPTMEPVLAESGNAGAVAVDGCDRIAAAGGAGIIVRSEDGGRTFERLEPTVAPTEYPALVFDAGGTLHVVFDAMGELLHLMFPPGALVGDASMILPSGRISGGEPRAHHAIAPFGGGALVVYRVPTLGAAALATLSSDGAIETRSVSHSLEFVESARVCASGGVFHAVYVDSVARRVRHVTGRSLADASTQTVADIADPDGTGWSHADVACFADGAALIVHVDGSEIRGTPASADGELGATRVLAEDVFNPFYPHVEARSADALVTWSASGAGELGYVLVDRDAEPLQPPDIAPDLDGDGAPDARPVHCKTDSGYVLVAQSRSQTSPEVPVHGATFLSNSGEPLEWHALVEGATNVSRAAVGCGPDGAWVLAASATDPLVLRRLTAPP